MADLGQQSDVVATRRVDRLNNMEYLQYAFAGNNDEWNAAQLLIPADILEGFLVRSFVRAHTAATPHVVDHS